MIVAAYSAGPIPKLPSLSLAEDVEFREAVSQIGITLGAGQSIEFYPERIDSLPVSITVDTRKDAVSQLSRIEDFLVPTDSVALSGELKTSEESLVGRVTVLDAQRHKFTLVLADGTEVHGWYREHPELLEDFREVVNSSADGPLTRLSGNLQTKGGNPFRFKGLNSIDRIQFDSTAWGERLTDFASLRSGWEEGSGEQITSVALDASQMLLRAIDRAQIERPGVFPTAEGGVLVEWASLVRVRSVEVMPDGTFELFSLRRDQSAGDHDMTVDLTVAIAFVEAERA